MSTSLDEAQDMKDLLWANYDPNDDLVYPTIENWDDLLAKTIKADGYNKLNKAEVLSILFGLIHRNRIFEGLWWSMFERGITRKLLEQLKEIDTNKLG